MKLHIGNYNPTRYVSQEACHLKCIKHRHLMHPCVWMYRTMNKQACRLSLCYAKTQSDKTDSPRGAVISQFGNMTALQWQTRGTVKQIVGLLHRLRMKKKRKPLPVLKWERKRDSVPYLKEIKMKTVQMQIRERWGFHCQGGNTNKLRFRASMQVILRSFL